MPLWIFLIIGVGLYALGDAFGDWSFKISRWWKRKIKPVVGRVGTRVRDAVSKTHPAQSTWDGEAPAERAIDWGAFLWKAKWAILIIVGFIVVVTFMRDWTGGRARLERDISRGETQTQVVVNDRDADIAALRQEVALLRQDLRHNAQRGRNEIIAAIPANEQSIDAGLVAAWRGSLDRLCVERADGSSADTCSR